jgi:hypothetical protein
VDEREYATYDIDKLAEHVTKFTLTAIDARSGISSAPSAASRTEAGR